MMMAAASAWSGLLRPLGAVASPAVQAQTPPLRVTIDIKPGDAVTSLEDRDGMVPVLLLTTPSFDAETADLDSIRLGPTGTEAMPVRSMLEDADKDGDVDRLMLFRVKELGVRCGVTVMRLTGRTVDGRAFEGSEDVRVEGC
jgi:hypothetical protein